MPQKPRNGGPKPPKMEAKASPRGPWRGSRRGFACKSADIEFDPLLPIQTAGPQGGKGFLFGGPGPQNRARKLEKGGLEKGTQKTLKKHKKDPKTGPPKRAAQKGPPKKALFGRPFLGT